MAAIENRQLVANVASGAMFPTVPGAPRTIWHDSPHRVPLWLPIETPRILCMASPTRGSGPSEELKRELDEHVRDDAAQPAERMPAEKFLADLRNKFKSVDPK